MAARPSSSAASRALSLTEELEKLEQSITLTLQEIDANFSRAHRIVTSSVIPIVQQYAAHSGAVWDSSAFWKDFFEASANISLTGYEEAAESDRNDDTLRSFDTATNDGEEDDATRSTATHDLTESDSSALERPTTRLDDESDLASSAADDSLLLGSPTASAGVTPRANNQKNTSRSETSRLSHNGSGSPASQHRQHAPATPRTRPSPFNIPPSTDRKPSAVRATSRFPQPQQDPLMHRVLDKNYRVQATPRTARRSPVRRPAHMTEHAPEPTRTLHPALDSSPFSPGVEAPQLRAEIFGSARPTRGRRAAPGTPRAAAPRTPGVSVQSGLRGRFASGRGGAVGVAAHSGFTPGAESARKTLFTGPRSTARRDATGATVEGDELGQHDEGVYDDETLQHDQDQGWDSGSDTGDAFFGAGVSPPKTVALNFPGSRVAVTPAREASRRLVEDLVRTAGGGSVTDEMSGEMRQPRWGDEGDVELDMSLADPEEEDSPSVVRVRGGADDSF